MDYANPLEWMGVDALIVAVREAGVDGTIVVDYPPEECEEFVAKMQDNGMEQIFLLAPTSTEKRIERVAKVGGWFTYYISLKGTTGATNIDTTEVAARVAAIRKHVNLPIGLGFDIRDTTTAKVVAQVSDDVVIGSRIIRELENTPREQALAAVENFLSEICKALDA